MGKRWQAGSSTIKLLGRKSSFLKSVKQEHIICQEQVFETPNDCAKSILKQPTKVDLATRILPEELLDDQRLAGNTLSWARSTNVLEIL
eukprot:bmy_22590T0